MSEDMTFITGVGIEGEHRDTVAHKKENELHDMNDQLEQTKHEYNRRVRTVKIKEGKLLKKQQHTMEQIERFKAYIQDTDQKRKTASRAIAERQQLADDKDRELRELRESFRKVQATKALLEKSNRNILSYPKYLDAVSAKSGTPDKDGLIAKYALLKETHRLSLERVGNLETEITRFQRQTVDLEHGIGNEILLKKAEVGKLREKIQEIANKTSSSADIIEQKDMQLKAVMREVRSIRNSIFNLYRQAQTSYPVSKVMVKFDPPTTNKFNSFTQRERTDYFFEHIKLQLGKARDRILEFREVVVPPSMQEQPDSVFLKMKKKKQKDKRRIKKRMLSSTTKSSSTISRSNLGTAGSLMMNQSEMLT